VADLLSLSDGSSLAQVLLDLLLVAEEGRSNAGMPSKAAPCP